MSEISTAGHGPPDGYAGMNNALKNYFRAKKDPHQLRVDKDFERYAHRRKMREKRRREEARRRKKR